MKKFLQHAWIIAASCTVLQAATFPDRAQAGQGYFRCGTFDGIPTTIFVNAKGQPIPLIQWSRSSAKRCDIVSNRFQSNFQNGTLRYLVPGINSGNQVVCASRVQERDDECDDERVLIRMNKKEAQDVINEIGNYMDQRQRNPGKHAPHFMVQTENGNSVIDMEYALRSIKPNHE